MMTVRFPSGFSVQYNNATYASRTQWGYTDLYTKENGAWIAQVPNDSLIEFTSPCRTYFAATPNDAVVLEKKALEHKVALLQKQVARLKKAVQP